MFLDSLWSLGHTVCVCVSWNQDKKFFEQMYEATKDILVNAFPGNYRQTIIEQELGRVLRTEQFNAHSARRQNTGHISESTLSVRELYSLKFEGDPSFKTRVLANLYQRKPVCPLCCWLW
jgi:hypothetical protein